MTQLECWTWGTRFPLCPACHRKQAYLVQLWGPSVSFLINAQPYTARESLTAVGDSASFHFSRAPPPKYQ
ncbi:hypothetical protein CSUI_010168 [Cystoisospora suis]|uniref:Uncharacterized protein n=1 Tax=Cystoisospora suis TaxID=483139 RepID=A0A2C6JZG7_9APIC|nr:hypothetical protein CSUI_010168 [Cystoisospora suis]